MKNILLITCCLFSINLFAQQPVFEWAMNIGGSYNDTVHDIELDSAGNVYATGAFQNTADFDTGPAVHSITSAGDRDVFVFKLNTDGDLQWAVSFGGDEDDIGVALEMDSDDNIYISGTFKGLATFSTGLDTISLTALGNLNDFFILKLDNDGNLLWVKNIGSDGNETIYDLSVDKNNNVYTSGTFGATCDFNPGLGIDSINNDNGSNFILKLNSSGDYLWTRTIEGYRLSIELDSLNNLYLSGTFGETIDADPGPATIPLTAIGYNDLFVIKLNPNGNFLWAENFGDDSEQYLSTKGFDMVVSEEGNIHVIGRSNGNVDFDPGPETEIISGSYEHYVLKLDTEGNFHWVRAIASGGDYIMNVALDDSNNVYVTGRGYPHYFNAELWSNNGELGHHLVKFDSSGTFVTAGFFRISRWSSFDSRNTPIAVDQANNIYTAGAMGNTMDFDFGLGIYEVTTNGDLDAFIFKMNQSCPHKPIISSSPNDLNSICYGDQITLNAEMPEGLTNIAYSWNSGEISNAIAPTVLSNSTYIINASYLIDSTICESKSSVEVTVDSVHFSLTDDLSFCGQTQATLEVEGGELYQWENGDTTNFISINPESSHTYNITVTNENGCSRSDSVSVIVNTLPEVQIIGELDICLGDTTILNAGEGDSYLWNTDETTNEIQVTPIENSTYYVMVADSNNCLGYDSIIVNVYSSIDTSLIIAQTCDSLLSGSFQFFFSNIYGCDSIVIIQNELIDLPEAPIIPMDTTIQQTATPFLLSIPEVPDATNYNWQIPSDAQIISGFNSNNITIAWEDQSAGGIICVSASNECGSSPSNCIEVNIETLNNTITLKKKGYLLYPNPTQDKVQITLPSGKLANYELRTINGKLIQRNNFIKETTISLAQQSSGVYMLLLKTKEGTWTERIIKI